MSQESDQASAQSAEERQPVVIGSYEDLESAQAKLIAVNYRIDEANAKRDRVIGRAKDRFDQIKRMAAEDASVITDPLEAEKAELISAVTKYLKSHERSWLRRFGKTYTNLFGTIKWRTPGTQVELPQDTGPVVELLLNYRGGKRFLIPSYAVDKKALTKASPRLKQALARRGVYIGRYRWLYMQLSGEAKPTTLDKWRFPRRRRK